MKYNLGMIALCMAALCAMEIINYYEIQDMKADIEILSGSIIHD